MQPRLNTAKKKAKNLFSGDKLRCSRDLCLAECSSRRESSSKWRPPDGCSGFSTLTQNKFTSNKIKLNRKKFNNILN